jgi:hypothetical protein
MTLARENKEVFTRLARERFRKTLAVNPDGLIATFDRI